MVAKLRAATLLRWCTAALMSVGLLVVGEAQTPTCPSGEIIIETSSGGAGCGTREDVPDVSLNGVMSTGSDVDLGLRYAIDDGVATVSVTPPAGTEAFLVRFDPTRGTYRSFDLGALDAQANTPTNRARIHRWLTADLGYQEPTLAHIGAMLADVDASKNTTLAESLRRAQEAQQQQYCTM